MDKGWRFKTNELKYISEVLSNGFGASETGAFTERLENAFAGRHDQKYAIGCNSGTSTLHTALEAFGVGSGDEVIIPAPYWVSYPDMVLLAGGKPKIIKCDEKDGFKLTAKKLQKVISKKTKWLI